MRTTAVLAALAAGALTGVLAGCSASPGDSADGLRGEWRLVAGADAAGTIGLGHSTVTLSIDGDVGGGTAACNRYEVNVTGGPGPVEVEALENTDFVCVPLNLMETELRYLSALSAVTAAELAGDELRLTTDNVELRFEAWADDAET